LAVIIGFFRGHLPLSMYMAILANGTRPKLGFSSRLAGSQTFIMKLILAEVRDPGNRGYRFAGVLLSFLTRCCYTCSWPALDAAGNHARLVVVEGRPGLPSLEAGPWVQYIQVFIAVRQDPIEATLRMSSMTPPSVDSSHDPRPPAGRQASLSRTPHLGKKCIGTGKKSMYRLCAA